jgi:hypothetical protein
MSSYFLSVKTKDGYKRIRVPKEVYIYVNLLENAVRYPYTREQLRELYSDTNRFEVNKETEKTMKTTSKRMKSKQ